MKLDDLIGKHVYVQFEQPASVKSDGGGDRPPSARSRIGSCTGQVLAVESGYMTIRTRVLFGVGTDAAWLARELTLMYPLKHLGSIQVEG